jgi:hypothetical protein
MTEPQSSHQTNPLIQRAHTMLLVQETTSMAGSTGKLLAGIGVCLGMGFIFATVMVAVLYEAFGSSGIGWSGWYLVFLAVLVPWLIWRERRWRASYMVDTMMEVSGKPSSRGEMEMDQMKVKIAFIMAMLVWGPRAVLDGYRGLRGSQTTAEKIIFNRAALLIADLAVIPGGVPIADLIHPPEDMRVFGSAVDLLDKHDWIGRSSDGLSLWLNSTFREKLRKAL